MQAKTTMAVTTMARSRREENTQRRAGTGRQTTKRNFSLNLFGLLAAPSPRLPLTERSPAQQQLPPVDEDAASCSAAGAMDVACDEPLAQPDAAAADGLEPEAFDTAHAPTPFRKSNKVMRTPAAGKDTGASDDDAPGSPTEEPAALPMSAFDDVADEPSPAAADVTSPAAAYTPVVAEEPADAPDAMDEEAEPPAEPSPTHSTTHSIGLSPIAAEQERLRKSMGTSPIAPELLQLIARPAFASSSTSPAGAWSPAAAPSLAGVQSPDGAESLAAEQSPAVEQSPGVQSPGVQSPATESPATAESPAVESPAVEQSPAQQSPAQQSPDVETPAQESPAAESPAVESPVVETPVAEEKPEAEELAEEPAADSDGDDGDGGGASDGGSPGFDDNCSMGDAEEEMEEAEEAAEEELPLAPEEEMPPPPTTTLGELLQQNMPAKPKGRAAPGSARKRKTSLDKLGRLPSGAEASTGLVLDAEGGRRSKRNKMAPLEFWRNERVEYGRRASAKFAVPIAVTFQPKEGTPNWVQRARARTVEHKAEAAPAKKRAGKKAASPQ